MNLRAAMFLIVAFSSGAIASWIGNCNRTFFTHGLSMCQRIALERLKRVKDITCDAAYKKQISCVESHVKKCLDGTRYVLFQGVVVEFTRIITFNCGGVDINANEQIFDMLCKTGAKQKFEMTTKCWDDFATKYKANKKDPTLCISLTDAKKCVANTTNHYCPAVQLETDSCNPFCANGTDDHRPCPAFPISLPTCEKDSYYKKEKECEETFIGALVNETTTSCSTEIPKLKTCIKTYYKENCFYPFANEILLEKLSNGVLSVTKGQRLFCNSENATDHPASLSDIISCRSSFYEKAEDCSREFRAKYRENKNSHTLCSVYDNAKTCFHGVQKKYCGFSPSLLLITKDTHNPFCTKKQVESYGLVLYLRWSTLSISLLLYIMH